uniref:Uncharacterized protein n=1 Tax=Candidatus Methanophagaceae archaeon ANME-1 ERB6 TaxID=2759912 RepID=A0A7G9YVV9_9EURY|nr:hypothetical protein MDNCFBIC_00013 [Methanosarcinales archaeon ANME-1 ERB6]
MKISPIVLSAILVLAVFTVFATPAMAEKPDIPEAGSYTYTTANLSATIGETLSTSWFYLTVDNCYDEHFAVWVDSDLLTSSSPSDFTVTQEFGAGDTAILTAGDIQVNRKVIPNGVDSFKIEYTITNNGATVVSDLRLFQVLDYDIYDISHDYAWYVPDTDWIWMTDERYYQCGYSGNIPSTRHGCDWWSTQIYDDYVDGNLNNQNRYPATGTADAGTGLQWNLGSLAAASSTSVTVTFWFGVPAGEEEPPTLCTDPDPPSHDFGSVPSGETRTWTFDITNCGAGTLTWSVSDDQTWISMSPTSGTTTTETDPVTVTIDTTGLTCDAEHTGTIAVNSDGGTKTGTIRVYVPCAAGPTVESALSSGTPHDIFQIGDPVYAIGSGYAPGTYMLYVMNDQTWTGGESLTTDPVTTASVTADAAGNIPVTQIWAYAAEGKYDIIVGVDGSGTYSTGDAIDGEINVGFEAIPEFSTIALPVASILGLFFFFNYRKRRREQ